MASLSDDDLAQALLAARWGAIDPTKPNFGVSFPAQGPTLSPYTPTLSERIGAWGQDALSGLGASRDYASNFGRGLQNVAGLIPGVGQAIAGYDAGRALGSGDYAGAGLAALGAIPMAGGAIGNVERGAERGFAAYHGSPHSFDQFDTSQIGTGEGAQVFGRGLYFAQNEDVARGYRDALSPRGQGHMYQVGIDADPNHFLDWDKGVSDQHPIVQNALGNLFSPFGDSSGVNPERLADVGRGNARVELDNLINGTNNLSTTHIDGVPLDEYGNRVAIKQAMSGKGSDLLSTIEALHGGAAEGADALRKAGVPGISYLDGASRDGGAGSRNFVVFDDKTISILKKYGLAGLGIGAGGALALDGATDRANATTTDGSKMANLYDQFDPPAAASNVYDQFAPAASAQSQPATPAPPQPAASAPWNGYLQMANAGLLGAGTREMAAIWALQDGVSKGQLWDQGTYDRGLAAVQGAKQAYETANPKTAFAADLAGSAVPAMLAGGAIGPVAARLAGEGVGGALLTNAGAGAVLGGANGAIETEGSGRDKLRAAMMQAGLGAGLGAAAVPVGAVAGKAAGAVGQKLADALYSRINGAGLTPGSADALGRAFSMQGQTPSEALAAAQGLGSGATFADTGTATRDLTARLAAREPEAAPVIAQNLTDRAAELGPRINDAVTQLAGPDFNAVDQLAKLKATTAANGRSGYQPILGSDATVDVRPIRDMIAQTRVDPIAEGVADDPISQAVRKAGSLFIGNNPEALSIRVAHNAQSAIGDMADSSLRSGNLAEARALTNVRNGLLDAMPNEYNAARQQYASDKAIEDAFAEGRNILASRSDGQVFDPDFLKARLNGMSSPEVDAYRLGSRKALTDVMGQARSDPAGISAKLANENGYAADKLRHVFGAGPTNALLDELEKQGTIRATNNLALGGSKTAMATAADNLIPTAKTVGAVGHAGGGALSMMAGAELGSHLGRSIGQETAGAILGAGAGTLWNGVAAPAINSGRLAAQDASRLALARALTERPTSAVVDALSRRGATANVGAATSSNTAALARALMIANAPHLVQEGQNAFGR